MRRPIVSTILGLLVALSMTLAPRGLVLAHETPGIGEVITYIGPDGAAAGTIMISALTDPYEDYDPSSPPARGSSFVRIDVTFVNSGSRPLEVDPSGLALQDSDGFLYSAGGLFLGSAATTTDPELTYQELPAGMEVSGWVGFEVLAGATLTGVYYILASDRLILLADLSAGAGAPTTTTTGAAAATVDPTESAAAEPTRSLAIGTDPAVAPTETAVATTGTGGISTGAVGISGNSYTSPNFGYIINWDETVWTSEETTETGFDRLLLENGTSQLYIEGTNAFGGDPAACLAANVEILSSAEGVSNYTPATDTAGNLLGSEDEISAVGIYTHTYTFGDGSTGELVNYIECLSMAPAVAADVVITNILLFEDFNFEEFKAASNAQYNVTSRLVLPGPGEMVPSQGPFHIVRGEAHDPYTTTPPTSGPHIGAEFAPWGVSTVPIEDEVQVHNLEHGGVMLQYACTCPAVVTLLESFADPATGYPVKVIAAPYAGMSADVTLTAWGHTLSLSEAEVTGATVVEFIDAYADHGPERSPDESAILAEWRAT